LDITKITFCGIQTKNHQGSIHWKDSYKWSKSFAKIKGIQHPYLIMLFNLRAKTNKLHDWCDLPSMDNKGRVDLEFNGLQGIHCFTSAIHTALLNLIVAEMDITQLQGKNVENIQWVKYVNLQVYCNNNDNVESSDDYQSSLAPHHSEGKRQTSAAPMQLGMFSSLPLNVPR
jgi:hypothetical protein